MSLAVTCTQRANSALLQSPPDVERARSLYERAIDAQTQLLAKAPDAFSNLTELGATHGNLAALENHVRRHGAARVQAERAIELQRAALEHRPQEPRVLLFLGIHHAQRAYALKELDAPEAALEAGRSAIGYAPTHASTVRMCAETAVAVARRQRADGEDAAAERSEALAVRWLAGLTEGTAQGVGALLQSPRFDALRARSDFRDLVEAAGR